MSFTITWTHPSPQDVKKYQIQRRPVLMEGKPFRTRLNGPIGNSGWVTIAETIKTNFTDDGKYLYSHRMFRFFYQQSNYLKPGWSYEYRVRSIDRLSGIKGEWMYAKDESSDTSQGEEGLPVDQGEEVTQDVELEDENLMAGE